MKLMDARKETFDHIELTALPYRMGCFATMCVVQGTIRADLP